LLNGRNCSMSAKIKVCHFTSIHPAGDTRIFVKECTSLARAGFEVFLVAVNAKEQMINGVQIVSVKVAESGRLKRMLFTTKKVYQKALELDADIYHFHDPELIPSGLKLIARGKKVIYDVHEDIPKQILAKYYIPGPFRKLISRYVERLEKRAAKKFSWIVTATPFIRDLFLKYSNHVTEVCNFPLAGELTAAVPYHTRPKQLCYVGSITRARGILEMIQAMDKLPYTLHLCGEFSPASLREEALKLPGWKQVVEHGFAPREVVRTVLESSRIGMVTLHPIINYMDAYPVKMFEYMMAGIPVIASDIPLWKQIVDETGAGICVDPLNPEAIRKAIVSLMEDEATSVKMGEAGRKAVMSKYNWNNEEIKLLAIYKTLSAQ
jgi:glycosyltransferase involved in cell wall biosynthesis